jgi:HlyD family secretion protein
MIQGTEAMDRAVTRRRSTTQRLLIVGGVLLPLIGGALAFPTVSRWLGSDRSVDRSRIRIGSVVRGELERDISVQGRTVAAFHPTAFSPAAGIVALEVRAGDVVEKATILARVDSPELESRLAQERSRLLGLEADLERQRILSGRSILSLRQTCDLAEVELDATRRAMERAEKSRQAGIVNDVEFETAQDDLRRAELKLEHARQDADLQKQTLEFEVRNRQLEVSRQRLVVDELERRVDELVIRAPVSGLVSRIDVENRDAVQPHQPLITVVDLTEFEIEIMIPEGYVDEIGPGTVALVSFAGEEYRGRVKSVSPEVEGTQVEGVLTFDGEGPSGLRQNQRVSARLILEFRTDVLKVPRGPFLEAGGGRQAYVVDDDLAVLRPIAVGALSVTEVEIASGLKEGDRIILSDTARYEGAERIFLRR